ncbi:MAG: transcription antitermination factor NusB [Gammaproteobacteria bacterium]|nr:transcription antitermination factor NusB [Gammaproteobacteria bacterium]|tara:strand:+ start:231 stop:713 length:483 start_codon:yes stop_codon:yes gene_type:complete
MTDKPPTPAKRRRARRFVLQGLYQLAMNGGSPDRVILQFREDFDLKRTDVDYFTELLSAIARDPEPLNEVMEPALDRPVAELTPIELAVLQIGVYELVHRIDVPYLVVINEGIELAKQFGATDSFKYVNSVLDRVAQTARAAERSRGNEAAGPGTDNANG